MTQIWLYSLGSVLVVSLTSLVGVATLAVNGDRWKQWLLYLVSFSAGALLGDVFLHLLPELAETGFDYRSGIYILCGILLFFILEMFVGWHHSHSQHSEEIHSMVYLTQFGDSLHNFMDGMIIAGSFLVSIPLGIATTVAVVFHEIPQEIGNFAILVHGGWKTTKALFYNFISALFAVLGTIVVLAFLKNQTQTPVVLLALGISSFIYIALSDVIPQLHREKNFQKSFFQLIWFMVGIAVMGLLLWLE